MTPALSPLRGVFVPPGDKSISHRALMLGAIAGGQSRIQGRLRAGDVDHTVSVLAQLGVSVQEAGEDLLVQGEGRFVSPEQPLDAGSSATTVRLMAGLLAPYACEVTFTGSRSLRSRPMARIFTPLAQMGITWEGLERAGCLPIRMCGGRLRGQEFSLGVASAQVQAGLLLAALGADGETLVRLPRPVRDHTTRMLVHLGVELTVHAPGVVSLRGGQTIAPFTLRVPGDASSAAFVGVAAAMLPGSDVEIRDVGLNPGRIGWLSVLERMGADVSISQDGEWSGEPVGRVRIRARSLRGTEISAAEVPGLIDELPILSMAAAVAEGSTRVSGAEELRVKESDRIQTICAGLTALGVRVETADDGFQVFGRPAGVDGGRVDAANDHRIALAFSVLSLRAGDHVALRGRETVRDSFPDFFRVLERLHDG